MSDPLWERIARIASDGRSAVVATVVRAHGSTPAKEGSRMIVRPDGEIEGTVGGGALEKSVIEDAKRLHQQFGTELKTYDLTRELGMCCGGRVDIFLERIGPTDRLFIFGAGHVAQPLAASAKLAGFFVTVVDERPDLLTPERFPSIDHRRISPAEEIAHSTAFSPTDSAVVVTHDHRLDQQLVEILLPQKLRYLGVIGSLAKAAKTRARLRAAGFPENDVARVRCPMGMNIGAKTPGEIAVSVVAQLLAERYEAQPPYKWATPTPL